MNSKIIFVFAAVAVLCLATVCLAAELEEAKERRDNFFSKKNLVANYYAGINNAIHTFWSTAIWTPLTTALYGALNTITGAKNCTCDMPFTNKEQSEKYNTMIAKKLTTFQINPSFLNYVYIVYGEWNLTFDCRRFAYLSYHWGLFKDWVNAQRIVHSYSLAVVENKEPLFDWTNCKDASGEVVVACTLLKENIRHSLSFWILPNSNNGECAVDKKL
eukprot:Nk52_evm4s389 gene=Nk52_evmTU4s389